MTTLHSRSICAGVALLVALHAQAAGPVFIALDGSPRAEAPAGEQLENGVTRVHKVAEPSLALFTASIRPSRGTVLVFPGGGYVYLSIDHDGQDVADLLNSAGYDAAILYYRVSEGWRTRSLALRDAKRALKLLQESGGKLGLETRSIGLLGFSAGGHLATRLAHESEHSGPPDFVALVYPAYLVDGDTLRRNVRPAAAPSFVYVAADDPYAPGSRAYANYCRAHSIQCEFFEAESGGHGFPIKGDLPDGVRDWTEKLRAFLRGL